MQKTPKWRVSHNIVVQCAPTWPSDVLTGFLLPSMASSKRVMCENTLNTALRRMGFGAEEMTAHGFRASFSTLVNESGVWNPVAIKKAIAHVEGLTMRKLCNRGKYFEEKVRLAEWWAEYAEDLKRKAYSTKQPTGTIASIASVPASPLKHALKDRLPPATSRSPARRSLTSL